MQEITLDDMKNAIEAQCRGWSGDRHWQWQAQLFEKVPTIRDVCILGVYHARDTAYAAALLKALGREHRITAVDLFSDEPCADWPDEKLGMTWEEAGFGPAPTIENARMNLTNLGLAENVELVRSDADSFLDNTDKTFDLIYIDTSHDYDTTRRTIQAALPRLRELGILAGDDFSNQDTWGVEKAVREACPTVRVFADWIWFAPKVEFYR